MGPRLALVAASSALLAAAPPPPPDTAAQQTIAGKWYSYTWGGLVPDDSKRCLLATVLERDYEIVPDAAGVRGIFSSITWTYVFSAQAPCTVGGHELRPAELTSRFWGLSGFGSRTPMRVSAAFQRCMGLYCSSPQTDKKDFTADLRRSGPGLSERDEDNAAWTQSYQRLDTFGKDLGEVREAAERVRGRLRFR